MPVSKRIEDGIPKQFKLAGHTICIANIPAKKWKHGKNCVGMYLPNEYRIEIIGSLKGSNRQQTFVHELLHCITDIAGYHELCSDEVFIDSTAHLLAQALTTFEPSTYDRPKT